MIDNTTMKLTMKNLGENIIERASEIPNQQQDYRSLIQQWVVIKGYIMGRIEALNELAEDIERRESD